MTERSRSAKISSVQAFSIDAEISKAWSLPSEAYTDPAVWGVEKEKIFANSWQIVGRRAQVANPGDFFTIELAGEPLLIVRDSHSALRGFYNVCRHRAGPPAEGCGSRKVFRCGYHGWTYALDGSLISAPEVEGVQDFDPSQVALAPVRVEEWFHLIFVNLDSQAPPLLSTLGEMPRQAERF